MPLVDFPDSPTTDDFHSIGDKTWQYDGDVWILVQPVGTLGNLSVNATRLADGSITTDKLAPGSVTQAKLASQLTAATTTTSSTISTDLPLPFLGQIAYETDTQYMRAWSGSSWTRISR